MRERSFRIATFNIHHAEGMDGAVDIARTAGVIKDLGVDLIALQELDVGAPRSGRVDQPEELAELLGMRIAFGPALDLKEGCYGIALASSEPMDVATVRLSRVASEEPRVALVGTWEGLGVVATHLSRDPTARALQTQQLADIAADLGDPSLVVGDLNQPTRALVPLTRQKMTPARPRRTALARLRPGWQIDHILVSEGLSIARAWTVATAASDHKPLVADVRRGT